MARPKGSKNAKKVQESAALSGRSLRLWAAQVAAKYNEDFRLNLSLVGLQAFAYAVETSYIRGGIDNLSEAIAK
jgi:hypothetical protein